MRESIMIYGAEQSDREILERAFLKKYILVFSNKPYRQPMQVNNGRYKIILFHLNSPDETPLLALRDIIHNDPLERPVIVITSDNDIDTDRFCAATGVFYRLGKPYMINDLETVINGALLYWDKKRITVWPAT